MEIVNLNMLDYDHTEYGKIHALVKSKTWEDVRSELSHEVRPSIWNGVAMETFIKVEDMISLNNMARMNRDLYHEITKEVKIE